MLSVIGLFTVLAVVILLLTNRVLPIVALILIPIIGALFAGFGGTDIGEFFRSGLIKVMPTATMFVFAILYFGIMQDAGLFNPLIKYVVKLSSGSVIAIAIGTVIIAAIAHLDGSGASTFLITIPALLPIYRQLKMSPYLLVLLVGASASIMNMVPWGGPLGRAASVIGADPTLLWHPLIPLQITALIVLILLAFMLGKREKKRILTGYNIDKGFIGKSFLDDDSNKTNTFHHTSSRLMLWLNFMLTILLIAFLVTGVFPTELTFMIALSIALPLNFNSVQKQMDRIKAHAPGALIMASIILAAGVFLGILQGTGMLKALAASIVSILPASIIPHLHIIIGFFGAPFELLLNTDAYYFALLPIVEQITSHYGVAPESTAYAMLIGNIIGTFISPFSPALWLALGLAGIEMGKYIKYAFFWIWGLSITLLGISYLLGIF
ncbi:CitMHS family transporter [Fangia hongkongensis]|uniref:CitMHS family transporter n=1 Tax=Fangia hongkongensis TaxID=270495 RepID=UPI000363FCF4|nr:citrate:proton symporter [Fangia hongkongensis]MBK2126217.1 citrate transporter [Fangia hongkongensis]